MAEAADAARKPYAIAGAFLLLGLLTAPLVYHHYDVVDCFLAWSRASEGTRPAGVYTPGAGADDCDYPPLVPYWLTAVEAARRAVGAPEVGVLTLVLLKLPNLLAAAAGVPLCLLGLRGPLGDGAARGAAVLFASSPALLVNGIWGQFDVVVAVLMLGAFVAALHDRGSLAGATLGLALATKLLAVVGVPLLAVALYRRGGLMALAKAAAAGALALGAVAAPMVLGGAGPAVLRAYTGAVHYYPYRTAEAYNTWYVLDRFDVLVRGLAYADIRRDDRLAFAGFTYQQIGLALFATATVLAVVWLWKRPGARMLFWLATLHLFAFFMLPTQVHQRYVVPAVAFAAVLAAGSRPGFWLFVGLSATATLNQGLDLLRALPREPLVTGALTASDFAWPLRTWRDLGALVGIVNVVLFAWSLAAFYRERRSAKADDRGARPA